MVNTTPNAKLVKAEGTFLEKNRSRKFDHANDFGVLLGIDIYILLIYVRLS